jgi:hypothetical protein
VITPGSPPSRTATQLLVVPKSKPTLLATSVPPVELNYLSQPQYKILAYYLQGCSLGHEVGALDLGVSRIMPVPQVKHAFSARERAPSQAKRRLRAKHRDRLSPFCTSRYLGLRGPCSFRVAAAVARFYLGRSMRTFMTIVRTAPHILLSLKKEGPTEQKPGLRAESRPLLEANRIYRHPSLSS